MSFPDPEQVEELSVSQDATAITAVWTKPNVYCDGLLYRLSWALDGVIGDPVDPVAELTSTLEITDNNVCPNIEVSVTSVIGENDGPVSTRTLQFGKSLTSRSIERRKIEKSYYNALNKYFIHSTRTTNNNRN